MAREMKDTNAKSEHLVGLDLSKVRTPAFVLEMDKFESNLRLLNRVALESGATILLAQKGFSCYAVYDMVKRYLGGTTSSGLNEALLAREFFPEGEIHIYSPAYADGELEMLAEFADSIVFNSENQIDKYANLVRLISEKSKWRKKNKRTGRTEIGLRVNPEYSEVDREIYNPCSRYSRLGARANTLSDKVSDKIDILHFHAMCEQNSDVLSRILPHFEAKFDSILRRVRNVNFGGGHHITRPDYNIPLLISLIRQFRDKYPNIERVYLEPGEAVALNSGVFLTRVLDVVPSGDKAKNIVIMDCAVPCHMPDVLEMPYRPNVVGAGKVGEKKFDCILSGRSCLAGDSVGTYSFDKMPSIGDILIFEDMAHYTTVKTNTFNGMNLPDIAIWHAESNKYEVLKSFGYEDFKARL